MPTLISGWFSNDPEVIAAATSIALVAGLFQLSDGAQVVGAGVLRGRGDTRTSAWANLIGHWGVGLPVGVFLAFYSGWGLRGIWIGLAVGLTSVAVVLTGKCLNLVARGPAVVPPNSP